MKVSVKEVGPCRRELHVEVDSGAVEAEFVRVTREFSQVASVSGFRKGKAPMQVVERRYARSIADETRDRLVPSSCREALSQKNIDPVALVRISDVSFSRGAAMSFNVVVDIPPSFKLPRYRGLPLKGNKVEITDARIDEAVRELRESAAVFEDTSGRPVREGDMAMVDYRAVCDDKPLAEIVPDTQFLGRISGYWILVGSPEEVIPGLGKGIVGAGVGETRDVEVTFPEGFRVKTLAGRKCRYTVTVKGMREKKLPESDAELLKKLNVASMDALRSTLRDSLVKRAQAEEDARLKSEIIKTLLEKTPVEVPDSLVDREARKIVQDIVMNSMARGATQKEIEGRHEDIVSSATKSSQDRVKLSYIIDKIADEEKVEVTDAEVDEYVATMARNYNVDKNTLRGQLDKRGEMENIKRSIRGEKTLDVILREAKIKTR